MKSKSLTTLCLVVAFMGLAACATQPIRSQEQDTQHKGQLLAYQTDSNGFDTKNYFYDNGKEVVVFDAQFTPAYARKSIEAIRAKTNSPIKYLVITHPNPDKFNGMTEFQKIGAKVIASRRTADAIPDVHAYKKYYFVKIAKMFTEATYPQPGKIDIVFDDTYTIRLQGGDEVKLTELGTPGVSTNQTVAYIPSLQSYVVGDLIHHKAHAWLEGGIVKDKPQPNLQQWHAALEQLLTLAKAQPQAKVYGGRGESATLVAAVQAQQSYLRQAEEIVQNYLEALGEKKAELKDSAKAAPHYQALQKKFETVFPDYKLGYMIGYGIYGLVQSKL